MIGFPLDSHVTHEPDGTPIWDRAVSSAPMRKLIKSLFSDGVLPNPSTNLQVSAGTGMNVLVSPGFATVNGCMKLEESQRTLAVQAASTAYDRIDTVVMRLNDNDSERICDLYILEGTPALSPVRPALTRTESIWEIGLADLFIAKNSTAVSNQRITDTRYENARCGVISSISEFDTTALYQQIQADLANFQNINESEFMAWFQSIKDQLSKDAAGNLQLQIDVEEKERTASDETLQKAIEAEKVARTNADNTLQGNIVAEVAERKNANTALETRITNEENARTNAVKSLNSAIEGEIEDRKRDIQNMDLECEVIKGMFSDYVPLKGTGTQTTPPMEGPFVSADVIVQEGNRIYFPYANGGNYDGARVYSTGRQNLTLGASNESNYLLNLGVMEKAWAFCPQNIDGTIRLGSPSHKWGQIYSTTASISTSDRRKKKDIENIDYSKIKGFLKELTPVFYRLIAFPDKKYAGLIAQDVEEAMKKHNIPEDFGLLDKQQVFDPEGKPTGDYTYGLCYEQLITLMLLVIQKELLSEHKKR